MISVFIWIDFTTYSLVKFLCWLNPPPKQWQFHQAFCLSWRVNVWTSENTHSSNKHPSGCFWGLQTWVEEVLESNHPIDVPTNTRWSLTSNITFTANLQYPGLPFKMFCNCSECSFIGPFSSNNHSGPNPLLDGF